LDENGKTLFFLNVNTKKNTKIQNQNEKKQLNIAIIWDASRSRQGSKFSELGYYF